MFFYAMVWTFRPSYYNTTIRMNHSIVYILHITTSLLHNCQGYWLTPQPVEVTTSLSHDQFTSRPFYVATILSHDQFSSRPAYVQSCWLTPRPIYVTTSLRHVQVRSRLVMSRPVYVTTSLRHDQFASRLPSCSRSSLFTFVAPWGTSLVWALTF